MRLEIEATLAREPRVIPVLVDGADMPDPGATCPRASHRCRAGRGWCSIPSRFDADVGRLLTVSDQTRASLSNTSVCRDYALGGGSNPSGQIVSLL